jgi:molybdopterin biosynthesis enzyme
MEIDAAVGQVLARDVKGGALLPPRPIALRDGWAVTSATVADATAYAPVPLMPNPRWLNSGDALPDDADAILPADAVTMTNGAAEACAAATPGDGVLGAGEDAKPDSVLRRAGEKLRATDVAVLHAAGVHAVMTRSPRFLVVAHHPAIDEPNDTVGTLIANAIKGRGCTVTRAWRGHDPHRLKTILLDEPADAVVLIGGTGEGRNDRSVRDFAGLGEVDFHGMGLRPGETAAFGGAQSCPVLLLPGRLDAALAVWLVVGQYMMRRLAGDEEGETGRVVKLVRKIVSMVGMAEVVLLARSEGGVVPLAAQHLPLQALARAAGWLLVPPESEGLAAGSTVEMRPLP